MPFYPSNAEDIMAENKRFKRDPERLISDEDILFLQNMKSQRTFTYTCKDKTYAEIEATRAEKEQKACARIEKEKIMKKD